MPRTAIPVVDLNTRAGVVIGATAVTPVEVTGDSTNHHSISGNDGRVIVHFRNTGGGTVNLTLLPGVTSPGFAFPNRTITRVGNGDLLIGPFPPSMFGETVNINTDSASCKFRAYRLLGAPSRAAIAPAGPTTVGSRVKVPLTSVSRAGVDITSGVSEVTGSSNGHFFANDGNVLILARSTSGSCNYNHVAAAVMDGQAITDYVAVVAIADPVEFAGPFPLPIYNQADGCVYLNSTTSSIRLRAFWLPYQE